MAKVLFIDTVHPVLWERLAAAGYDCRAHYSTPRHELEKILPDFEGIVIRSRIKIDRPFLDLAPQLKWIARSGSGLENIDVPYARSLNIECYNSPEGNRDAVGEHAVGMLLMLMNRLNIADREVRQGTWKREENRGHEIAGRTVGIIGYGRMGSATAQKLSGFGCNILAYDKYKTHFGNPAVKECTLEQLQQESDIISIHLPLTAETHYYVDDTFIANCGRPFYLVNTARGQHVNTNALLNGLRSGKVLGACLDVLEFENFSFEQLQQELLPESYRELINSDKVVLSPHIAGWTHESHVKLANVLADKILGLF